MDAPGFRFRNLAAPLAAWLRAQGWTALEQAGVSTAILTAHWYTPAGDCFCLDYQWHSGTPGMACCCLALRAAGGTRETLFTNTAVRRLREARTMLCNNLVYMASRRAIAGPVGA